MTRARAQVAGHPALWSTDTWVPEMAQITGVTGTALSIEAGERLFDLLASRIPRLRSDLAVLREFMHYLVVCRNPLDGLRQL